MSSLDAPAPTVRRLMDRPSRHLWLPPVRDPVWVSARFGHR